MPAVTITAEQMDKLLSILNFRTISLPGTKELVYARGFHRLCADGFTLQCSQRVYTTIENGVSRPLGDDAIHVSVWCVAPRGDIIMLGGSKRVHRMENWRSNLVDRINQRDEMMKPFCPVCGAPMLLKKPRKAGAWQPFYGCIRFPQCTGSISA